MLYSSFWVMPRRLNILWRRFETLCSIFEGLFKRHVTMERSVPKRRHRTFRRRGITQKKEYNKEEFVVTVILTPVLNMS